MKVTTESLEQHQLKLYVETDPEELEDAKQRAARKLAKKVKIPGFRPGKAPYPVIERTIGPQAILEEAIEILASDVYPRALTEVDAKPYAPGSFEKVENLDQPKFEFIVPLQPEVDLGEYTGVRVDYEDVFVTDDEVESSLLEMRESHAIIEPVDRPAQEGDEVRVVLSGIRTNVDEGQDPTLVQRRTYPVVVESESADTQYEWPFPGFSRELVGLKVGDAKVISHTFPEDSQYTSLRGVSAQFTVEIEQVSSRTLPELTDELALEISEMDTLDGLRDDIRHNLKHNKENTYHRSYDEDVLGKIIEGASVKYPPQMIDHEVEHLLEDLNQRLGQQGLDLETYKKLNNKDDEALKQEMQETAKTRLRRSLVLYEIARQEDIQISNDEVQNETVSYLNYASQALSEKDMRQFTRPESMQGLVSQIMNDLLVRKTYDRIRSIASGRTPVAEENDETPATDTLAIDAAQETTSEPVNEENAE